MRRNRGKAPPYDEERSILLHPASSLLSDAKGKYLSSRTWIAERLKMGAVGPAECRK
jgi:hypothetical protein